MRLRILITIIIILSALTVHASPAKRGVMTLMQPDGTSFKAVLKGDEFTRIKTTTDGQTIMQDEDGWWCYAIYGADGTKTCTGMKVGQTASGAIPAESREIPHAALSSLARERRSVAGRMRQDDLGMMNRLKVLRTKGEETIKHGIVILAEFQDVRFTNTKADFEAMLLQPGYDRYGATGSAKEYFDDQFGGLIEFDFYVSEIVTLKGKREFYGSNKSNGDDMRPTDMIVDACTLADEEVDFSLYDDDKDGVVDNVFVFFAGEDEAEGGVRADEILNALAARRLGRSGLGFLPRGELLLPRAVEGALTLVHRRLGGVLRLFLCLRGLRKGDPFVLLADPSVDPPI